MGLLTVPKKYNPPGNGKRDMESLIYATRAEQGLLKARGGSGKMTKHGIRSFGLGDRGNSVGSAGASNYSGNGAGGQVNLDHVGGNTGNVLRNIAGVWTVVNKATGNPVGSDTNRVGMPTTPKPIAVPVPRPAAVPQITPAAAPTAAASYFGDISSYPGTAPPARPAPAPINNSSYFGDISSYSPPAVNRVSQLNPAAVRDDRMPTGSFQPSSYHAPAERTDRMSTGSFQPAGYRAPATRDDRQPSSYQPTGYREPMVRTDRDPPAPAPNSMEALSAEAERRVNASIMREQYSQYRSPPGRAANQTFPTVADNDEIRALSDHLKYGADMGRYGTTVPQLATPDRRFNVGVMDTPRLGADPTMPGRYPGAGVPDVPNYGQDFAKTPGERVNLPASPDNAPSAPLGSQFGPRAPNPYAVTDMTANPQTTMPNNYPNIASSVGQPKQFTDRVPQQQANISPQNYGFQSPARSPAEVRSIVNQWRDNQIANNMAHRGIGQFPGSTQTASVDPAGGYVDSQPTNINPPGQDAIDRTAMANIQAQNDAGPQPPEQDLYARQNKVQQIASRIMDHISPGEFGPGGSGRSDHQENGVNSGGGGGRTKTPRDKGGKDQPVTPPVTSPMVNQIPWFYPQYQSTWANLPTGQGGMFGRA